MVLCVNTELEECGSGREGGINATARFWPQLIKGVQKIKTPAVISLLGLHIVNLYDWKVLWGGGGPDTHKNETLKSAIDFNCLQPDVKLMSSFLIRT